MPVLNINHIPRIPILTRQKNPDDNITKPVTEKSADVSFKDIFREQFQVQAPEKSQKLQKIKERISSNYYMKTDISEIIAEKLMNGWT